MADANPPQPFLSLKSIERSYGDTRVLKGVSLDFYQGKIHGLVGENGAGKSTLAKIAAGVVSFDQGQIFVAGMPVKLRSPRDAIQYGVTMLTQELNLVPQSSILDNVFLGNQSHRVGFVSSNREKRRFQELRDQLGFDQLEPDQLVGSLSMAKKQQVEVARAVARGARMVIFDEPTAVLSAQDTEQMLNLMRRLASGGMCVVLISHFLEEILAIANTVSVLRDGELIHTGLAENQTVNGLISNMVGEDLDILYPKINEISEDAPVILKVDRLRRSNAVRDVSFTVHKGEIVGLAGLVGSGRTEIARLIFGADRLESGEVFVRDQILPIKRPSDAIEHGVVMVPENRKEDGLALNLSIYDNIALANLSEFGRFSFVRTSEVRRRTNDLVSRFMIRASDLGGSVATFSGGNQQKVLIAKWLVREPVILIADEPTRGVDIKAKAEIHRLLVDLAANGLGILLISSEIEEIIGLSHMIHVIRQGQIVRSFRRGEAQKASILAAAFRDSAEEQAL